jgi:hypothetical protein
VKTLGRYFHREVVIEQGQTIHPDWPLPVNPSSGVRRQLAYPVRIGRRRRVWVGAALGTLIALVALIPRIRVEEDALHDAFGESFAAYAVQTARLIPGVW